MTQPGSGPIDWRSVPVTGFSSSTYTGAPRLVALSGVRPSPTRTSTTDDGSKGAPETTGAPQMGELEGVPVGLGVLNEEGGGVADADPDTLKPILGETETEGVDEEVEVEVGEADGVAEGAKGASATPRHCVPAQGAATCVNTSATVS